MCVVHTGRMYTPKIFAQYVIAVPTVTRLVQVPPTLSSLSRTDSLAPSPHTHSPNTIKPSEGCGAPVLWRSFCTHRNRLRLIISHDIAHQRSRRWALCALRLRHKHTERAPTQTSRLRTPPFSIISHTRSHAWIGGAAKRTLPLPPRNPS